MTAPPPLELRELRHFLAAAEEGSFAAGSGRLGLSPQALAAATARLERRLGRTLFVRGGRDGLQLTPAGLELLAGARDLVVRADGLEAEARAMQESARARLRVGLLPGAGGPLIVPILRTFALRHPGVAVTVHELGVEQTPDLLERRVDVALVLPPLDDERVHVEPLLAVPRVACVPFATALGDAELLTPGDLLDQTFGPRYPWETDRWEGQWSLLPERGGDQPRRLRARGERTPIQQFMRFVNDHAVIVLPAQFAPVLAGIGLRAIPVSGLGPAHLALARLPDGSAAAVAFIASARETARGLGPLIPGAQAPPAGAVGDPGPALPFRAAERP